MKRSDFQKGVIDTVTSADQIIVLDSDGSIEPQIIDFAKVVTSNPFTGAFWPNSSTALTGAGLANSDRIPVLDGTVPKYIEADELAQGSQFTSRYKSLTSERIFVPAGLALAVSGSPTMGTLGAATVVFYQSPVLLFDASADEFANIWCGLPAGWTTYDIYMYWSNAGAGSGDVKWYGNWGSFGDGDNTDTSINGDVVTVAAPAQYVIKRTKLNTTAIATNSDGLGRLAILREGSHATDTLGNDAGIIGFEWVRAS